MNFLYWLQSIRQPFLDAVMSCVTYLGSDIIIIASLCIAYWCLNKKLAYKLGFTYFISGLLVQGLKVACRIERPWVRDSRLYPVEAAKAGATGYSFPSGHTQGVTGLFSSLAFHIKKTWTSIAAAIIIVLVIFSRMYLGCHTPADVGVSFAITITTSVLVSLIYDRVKINAAKRTGIAIAIEVISAALIGYCAYVVSAGLSTPALTMDCFKAAGAGIGFGIGWYIETSYIKFDPKASPNIGIQIVKFIIGLGIALALKEGIKAVFGEGIVVSIIRYAVLVLWVIGLYPLIIRRFFSGSKSNKEA